MQVLDTTALPPTDRVAAFQHAVSSNSTVSLATFDDPADFVAECHVVPLGVAKVFTIEATGTTLRRTPRAARAMNESPIACALPLRTTNRLERDGGDDVRAFGARDLILVDLSSPYVYGWSGPGASYALHVEYDDLALPMDQIRRAIADPTASPLYPLVRDHMLRVLTGAESIGAGGAAADVGAASVALMRALIVSVAGDARQQREALHATERTRVEAYLRAHLRDRDLSPARIAAAAGISVRLLYKLYESRGRSLEQVVIEQRLEGARGDLARPALQHRTIAAVARSWGFTSPSFFTSRFHQAFGVTPREWRARHARTTPAP
ncbi:helix-turn-helix domain-containing protein [Cellulomonas sp. P4]|uniref:helix-turn-helix domain-containing protein n=1 Tax=Cellulomonas sp. P4 TaxID=3142533 RepID=UPI0031BB1006